MKAILYHDTRKANRDADDAWSMFFPLPKRMRAKSGERGCFLGCKPTEYGMVRCTWENAEVGGKLFLGKRVDVKQTPKAFQKIFFRLERLWNDAITKDTSEAWDTWYRA